MGSCPLTSPSDRVLNGVTAMKNFVSLNLRYLNSNFKMPFWMENDQSSFQEELKCLENLTLNAKDAENSIKSFKKIAANIMPLIVTFSEFSRKFEETLEVCKYWNRIVEMTNRLQNLVSANREGNWDNHIQAVKDLLPIFIETDSINYLRYASWYFEIIRQLHITHPDMCEQFKANHVCCENK